MSLYAEVVFNLPVRKSFSYLLPEDGSLGPGFRVLAPFGKRSLGGYVIGICDRPPEGVGEIKSIIRAIDKRPLFNPSQVELARWLSGMYLCSLGEALSSMLPGGRREKEADEFPAEPPEGKSFTLSPEQRAAVERITGAGAGFFYLQGVTGSGKTEVFLQVAKAMFQRGRGVIYLVPEISLTHQVVESFVAVFGQAIAVLHSGLTPSQRLQEWLKILEGRVRLVIGARSAVFAPVQNLGLIVLDEEHEGSYKSGSAPRYHARQVAMHRCTLEQAALVMGSATPSVEAYYHMNTGAVERLLLPRRLSGGAMPEVVVQDVKGESGPLSRSLMAEIRRTHAQGRQSILFLNRRGFATFFHCRSCGREITCRNCSVAMTYHKSQKVLVCHYCGFKMAPVEACPSCGSIDMGYSGFGTERIEEEIAKLFPDLTVCRIDTDAMRRRKLLARVLSDFRQGRIHVLLGTQMVAKGLNFPGVKLVGIVNADTGLQLPDFRAAERTFNLIVQVSGRAGRFHADGKVVVQTFRPENETIRLAAAGKLADFYERELRVRQQLGFPPFTRLIRLVFRARNAKKARQAASDFQGLLAGEGEGAVDTLGPAECPLAVLAGNQRFHLICRSKSFPALHSRVSRALEIYKPPAGVYVEVDVDPVSLL